MLICQTKRLLIRQMCTGDAEFVLRQVNEPSWLANVGDRGVRNLDDAKHFVESRIEPHYREFGFGMFVLVDKLSQQLVGMCGLVKRDFLPVPDLGYALLEEYSNQGYAYEAADAILQHAETEFGLGELYAMTSGNNTSSIRLLEKLGFELDDAAFVTPDGEQVNLYVRRNSIPVEPAGQAS